MGVFVGGWGLFQWQRDSKVNSALREDIVRSATNDGAGTEEFRVDFEKLRGENADTVGYIRNKSLNIDYPVVKTGDNSYYLDHNFQKEYNIAGWIFGDYRNRFDGTDRNLVIYGHNSYDENMFSLLSKTLEEEWRKVPENLIIELYTPSGPEEGVKYQVFSTYSYEAEDYYITTDFGSEEEYGRFLETIRGRSNYDYGVEVGTGDQIITLSSCTADGRRRIVVHGRKI